MKLKEYKYKINGTKFTVKIGDVEDNTVHVEVNGVPYNVELEKEPGRKLQFPVLLKARNRLHAPKAAKRSSPLLRCPLQTDLLSRPLCLALS